MNDNIRVVDGDVYVSDKKPEDFLAAYREQARNLFKPRHVLDAEKLKPNFEGIYTLVLKDPIDGRTYTRHYTRDQIKTMTKCQTSDRTKPMWYIEFWA